MSLRTRLLIAIGVIAVVALAIADIVTYSALQSFLYQRIDQQLTSFHAPWEHSVEQATGQGTTLSCLGGAGGPFGNPGSGPPTAEPHTPGTGAFRALQTQAVQVLSLIHI